jgi:hypothetical protein
MTPAASPEKVRSLIITDQTRFSDGNSDVCIAGIDRQTGECIRPKPYLSYDECKQLGIFPGGILTGEFTRFAKDDPPHFEDYYRENLNFEGLCSPDEFHGILKHSCVDSVASGFGLKSPPVGRVITKEMEPKCSIITLGMRPSEVQIVEDKFKAGSIRLNFKDSSGFEGWYFPITDLGFHHFAKHYFEKQSLRLLNKEIWKQSEVFIRIGLSRLFENDQKNKSGFWMQANGIYTFPEIVGNIRSYPYLEQPGVEAAPGNPVFTIGHSNHSIESFLDLLLKHDVKAIADVRSMPASRHNPQFNQVLLRQTLRRNGIDYVFLGKELGARSEDRSCYLNGRVQYARLAQTGLFKSGLARVMKGSAKYNLALMCSEKEPLDCHRTILVSRELARKGVKVFHIHGDGRLETHEDSIERLLGITHVPDQDMFVPREKLIELALGKQEERIAYVERDAPSCPASNQMS